MWIVEWGSEPEASCCARTKERCMQWVIEQVKNSILFEYEIAEKGEDCVWFKVYDKEYKDCSFDVLIYKVVFLD